MNNRGPRSAPGKAAISNNGLKHGLTAAAIVLPSEDAADWTSFHDDVCSQLNVEGSVEAALASRVAELLWRIRRVVRAEQQCVSALQVHRDALVADSETVDTLPSKQSVGPDGPLHGAAPKADLIQRVTKEFGFYAGAIQASDAMERYQQTLPVLLPGDKQLDKIMKYEAHLSRLLNHTLHELEALQDRRRGNPTHLARLDIN